MRCKLILEVKPHTVYCTYSKGIIILRLPVPTPHLTPACLSGRQLVLSFLLPSSTTQTVLCGRSHYEGTQCAQGSNSPDRHTGLYPPPSHPYIFTCMYILCGYKAHFNSHNNSLLLLHASKCNCADFPSLNIYLIKIVFRTYLWFIKVIQTRK